MIGELRYISYQEAIDFLLPKHYSGRKPQIKYAFGWYIESKLKAVVTYGKPASHSLCKGIMQGEYQPNVYELNRVCKTEDLEIQISSFISATLRRLKSENLIIVSYADTEMNHHGYIYQACNFLYTGATKSRTDKYTDGNKHSRHYDKLSIETKRKIRSSKHRYVFFCTHNKKLKKEWEQKLSYKIQPYPKGENKYYILGEFLIPTIIEGKLNERT